MIPIAKPVIGDEEKQAVLEVLDSGILAQGPRVKAFEEAFALALVRSGQMTRQEELRGRLGMIGVGCDGLLAVGSH